MSYPCIIITVFFQSARHRHPGNLEMLFAAPLALIRKYAGPHALQTCYMQMAASVYYYTESVLLPAALTSWVRCRSMYYAGGSKN